MVFDCERLLATAREMNPVFVNARPFPHIVLDHFMGTELLERALAEFPGPAQHTFYSYDNPFEKKIAFDQILRLPPALREILIEMNAPGFLRFLEELSGIQGLIPDPYYRGCGIHAVEQGGKLDIHLDFNKHKKLGLNRKLNVLLYLNPDWQEDFGGHLELWSSQKAGGQWVLSRCEKKIAPLFNRLVVFAYTEQSFHGHPEPLRCPAGWSRKALMATYYLSPALEENQEEPHSTIYMRRPDDPVHEEVEALRKKRSQQRLASNLQNEFTA